MKKGSSSKSAELIPMHVDANFEERIWRVIGFRRSSQEYQLITEVDGHDAEVWVDQDELICENPMTAARVWGIPVKKISAATSHRMAVTK